MPVYRVRVELKRIQTYLFAVPRLRTILGANALVGETLRQRLAQAAKDAGAGLPDSTTAPADLKQWKCQMLAQASAHLQQEPWKSWSQDDPFAGYESGILTRDGGHFQALFPSDTAAKLFVDKAEVLLARYLPGVMTSVQLECWAAEQGQDELGTGRWSAVQHDTRKATQHFFELPGSQVCQLSGQGPATVKIDVGEGRCSVSPLVAKQWHAGSSFRDGTTHDIVGILQRSRDAGGKHLLPCWDDGHEQRWKAAEDLTSLAGGKGRYLALVLVDGNGVGSRTPKVPQGDNRKPTPQDFGKWLEHEANVEAFFASMRQQVRLALVEALRDTFADAKRGVRPYQLLMLGGDDLLLACQAEYALPFVVHYAAALKGKLLSDKQPLDVGAGVAIAQPTFPFHALHALAEELASSAKRLSRACPGHSVVDWMVVTNASVADPAEHRRRHDWVRYRLQANGPVEQVVLNARPYFVLDDDQRQHSGSKPSLQKLLAIAAAIRPADAPADRDVARSQLKQLPGGLRAGRRAGQHAFDVLPRGIRKSLRDSGIGQPWIELASNTWFTALADLVEVSEIGLLGRRRSGDPRRPQVAPEDNTDPVANVEGGEPVR